MIKYRFKSLILVLMFFTLGCSATNDTVVDNSISDETVNNDKNSVVGPSFSFTTKTSKGDYSPRHTQAIWIEDMSGNVVKTLGRWANKYVWTLHWNDLDGVDIDVKTGASQTSHGDIVVESWDLQDKDGNSIENGEYKLFIEYNENNDVSMHKISESIIEISDKVEFVTKDENEFITNLNVVNE